MKKNMVLIILGTVVVAALLIVTILLLAGVFKKKEPIALEDVGSDSVVVEESGSDSPGGNADYVTYDGYTELIALADSEEAAKEIAELYGIELKRHENGVAVFVTKENPADVIKRGEENGWPTVSVNTIIHLSPIETSSEERPIMIYKAK